MEEQACPRCKTTKYRNPSLKLMVNVCGHTLCESCVDLLFLKGSGACPECHIPLRRGNFRVQMFEDSMVEKEIDIRKRVLRDYNKKEEDFDNIRDYNDYLEEIETIVYNLSNNIDVPETNKRIEQYKRDNKEQILRNKTRLGRMENEIEEMMELERQRDEERKMEVAREEIETKKKRMREKEALIDELMFSDGNAKSIVETFANNSVHSSMNAGEKAKTIGSSGGGGVGAPRATQFSTGIKFGKGGGHSYMPIPKIDEGPTFSYVPIVQEIEGPQPPGSRELQTRGYVAHVRPENKSERAGGFKAQIACLRALQDAMAGLYHNPCNQRQSIEQPMQSI